MEIRDERSSDCSAVRRLHLASFPGPGEADLVDRLRTDGDAIISLVATQSGQLTGHVMFSRMAAPFPSLGLGPVAVASEFRRKGIAAELIRRGIDRARQESWIGVFVVGDPNYYRRFGFEVSRATGFESPYAGPYLMALPLSAMEFPVQNGRIDYAPAFSSLA